jgi:predicted nucleic acid-binding protein
LPIEDRSLLDTDILIEVLRQRDAAGVEEWWRLGRNHG